MGAKRPEDLDVTGEKLVGAAGFEPTTPSPPVKCATRLRYAPADVIIAAAQMACNRLFDTDIFMRAAAA